MDPGNIPITSIQQVKIGLDFYRVTVGKFEKFDVFIA